MILSKRAVVLICAVGGVCALAAAWQESKKLYLNGQVASSDLRIIDGKSYVPVTDVAKALDLTIQKRDDGYELVKGGGAGQIANSSTGKIGSEVFTGQWRFKVQSMERSKHYDVKYSTYSYRRTYDPKDGFEFVVLSCQVKNGRTEKDELVLGKWDGNNTALTDSAEQTYEPTFYDVKETEGSPTGVSFLPGSAINFVLVFEVPVGTKVKDLVFTAIRYQYRGKFDQDKVKPTDIRVALE